MTPEQTAAIHEILRGLGRSRTSFKKFAPPQPRATGPHKINQMVYVPPSGFVSRTMLGDRVIR